MQIPPGTVYRFGPFAVDPAAGELLKLGKRVKIQDQPFRLLLVLLENAGKVVTRAEIQNQIWEVNTFVDFDSSLRVAVCCSAPLPSIPISPWPTTTWGWLSSMRGTKEHEDEYLRKAYSLIGRVSEYERYLISSGYYQSIGDLNKDVDVYRLAVANYPRVWGFHNDLSTDLIDLGQFEDGLREGLAATKLQPNVEPPYRRLLDAYMCLGQLREARAVSEKARLQGIDGARIHQRFLEIAYIEGDQAAAAREIQWFAGRPEEYLSFSLQAANLNLLGQRSQSGELYRRAAKTAQIQGLQSVAARFEEADARADALVGNCGTVRRLGRPALALAMCGETAQAEKFITENLRLFPTDTLWNNVQLPVIRAAIELQRDRPARAIDLLASAIPFERAYPETVYLRGQSYLRLHKGAKAAAESRRFWTTRAPIGAVRGSMQIGDNIIRSPMSDRHALPCSRAKRPRRRWRTRISSHYGKTRTLNLPS